MYCVMRASVPSLHNVYRRYDTHIPIYIYIYIEKSLPDVRLGWLAPARQLGECMALLASGSDPTV